MATTPSDPTSNNNESLGGQGLGDFFGDKKATQASGTRGLGDFFQDPVAQPTYQPSKPIDTTQIDNIANSEGLTPTQRQVMGALLAQESGGNASVGNSVDGARGIGQIMPATFKMYAKAGEDIANPDHNLAVMARIVKDLGTKSGDDPAKIATGYFSGAGNINNNGTQAWKNDAADGNGKRVSSYVTDVINRMNSGGVVSVQQNQNQPKPLAADSAPTWKSIISKPEYMSMSAQEKAGMRDYYFNKYIAPDLQGDQVAQAKSWFDGEAAKIEPKELTLLDRAKATVQKLYSSGTTQPDNPDAVYDPVTGVDLSGSSVAAPKDESLGVMGNYKGTGTPEKFDATKVGFAQASKNKIAYDRETERLKQLAASTGGVGLTSSEGKKLTPLDEEAFYKYNNDPLYSNTVVRSAVKGWEGLKQGAYGVNQAVWDLVGADRYAKDQGAKGDQSRAKILSMGEPENYGMRMLEGAVTSIAQQLPSMIGGIATGSECMVLGSMFVNSFGQEYGQGKMSGLDSRDAAMRAGLFGSFEVLGEKAGLKFNMDKIRQATKGMSPDLLKGWLANTLTKELPGEFLTTTGQFMTDKASFGLNKEAGLADYLQQMADTGVQTILQSGLMAGGTNAIAKGVDKFNGVPTDVSLTNEGKTSDQAVQDAEPAPIAEAAPTTTPVAEAAPVTKAAPTAEDQYVADYADSRREMLIAKREGTLVDQISEDGTKIVSVDKAGKGLSKAEQAELQAIEQAGGDVAKLNELYGITKETPANVPEPAKVEQEAQAAQGQEVAQKEDDYSTRYKDRVDRIKNASSSEEVDSILQSEYADGERHMVGTGLVERTAKSAKYSLDAKKKSIDQQQKYDSGEWVQIPDGGPGKTAAENIANKLGSEDANSEYRVSYNNDNYYVEKRKKPVAAAEPAPVEQAQPAEDKLAVMSRLMEQAKAEKGIDKPTERNKAFQRGMNDAVDGMEPQRASSAYIEGHIFATEKLKAESQPTETVKNEPQAVETKQAEAQGQEQQAAAEPVKAEKAATGVPEATAGSAQPEPVAKPKTEKEAKLRKASKEELDHLFGVLQKKQIPDMTNEELQKARSIYGPDHKRRPKIEKEIKKRAAATWVEEDDAVKDATAIAQNKPKTEKEAKERKQATPRDMTYEGRAVDGKPISGGDVFNTSSGKATTPYPSQKQEKYASQWLVDNAVAEAQSRGDDFNSTIFKGTTLLKSGMLTDADRMSMQEYLFGEQPAVVPSILKPLANKSPVNNLDTTIAQKTDATNQAMQELGIKEGADGKINISDDQQSQINDRVEEISHLKFIENQIEQTKQEIIDLKEAAKNSGRPTINDSKIESAETFLTQMRQAHDEISINEAKRNKKDEAPKAAEQDLDSMFDDVLAEEVAKAKPVKPKTERAAKEAKLALGTIVNGDNQRAQADRLEKLVEQMENTNDKRMHSRNEPETSAKVIVKNIVEELRKKHTTSDVNGLLIIAASRLKKNYGSMADELYEVQNALKGGEKTQVTVYPMPVKPKTEKEARTTKAAAVSAAKNTAEGFGNAIDGLGKLFGGKGTFGSGPVFNEETYAKAKPLFQAAVANFNQAGADIKEVMRAVVKSVLDKFGETVVNNMKPYIVRFVGEYNQQATKEQANDSTTTTGASEVNSDLAQGEQPAGSKTPARGTKQPRAGDGRANDRGVRKPRGRTQAANDGQQELGYSGRTDAVSDGQNDAVAGSGKRVSADFIPAAGDLTRTGSWFATAKRNIDLIELAIKIESENRLATPEEQAQLAKYVGFGASAIRNTLFPVPSEYSKRAEPTRLIWPNLIREERWQELAKRMEALPQAWQKSVLQSSQYAHYTSEGIIRSTWSAMQRLGFTGGKVFEPGMGIGSFSMLMPENVRNTSKYTGIEFDGPTALIAKLLQPEQHMLHDDFIKRKLPKDFFDVAIGNPPFSQTQIYGDSDYEKYGFMLHDFFFAKAIDRVRPGGLLAFVTSKGTMDKQNDKARKYLSERADLLGAIRLPSTAFEDNAGTSVVTDVIFLRKRAEGEAPAGKAWNTVATVETKDGPVVINEYFAANPEMVLGQNRISGNVDDEGRRININGMGGEKYTVVSYDKTPAELDAKFAAAVERLPENVYSVLAQNADEIKTETAKVDFDPAVKREGVVYIGGDGTLMRVESGVGKPLADGMKMTEADVKWFKGYVGLREMVQTARQAQVTDGNWEAELKKLNKAYDAFRKEHGPINDFRVQVRKSTDEDGNVVETESRIFKNRRRFREDYDAAILTQLETINEAGEIVKSPFLTGRTIGKPVTREVKSIGDALAVSLNSVGRLNIDDVAARIGLSKDEAIEALGNQIYKAPKGDWQLSDEYLSGDVVAKLEEAELAARIDPSLKRNVEALKEVQPEKLGPSQISAKLGASWVPESHVNAFAKEIDAGAVKFDPQTESWQVDGGNARNERKAGAEYGTAARSPSELLEAALNSRSVKITSKTAEGKTVTDAEATTAANEMLKKIKDKFKGWVWTDTERAAELMESYNKRFNNIAARRFDGSHLTLPGVSLRFKLHPHQLRAIWRIIQTGNTYLAHAVGAGKTIEMIAAGMEQKRLGLIKKPLYVVPNHMLEQFSNEFMELYPLANIMVADDENFSADRRKAFIANATLNNPDAVIITHDAYQRIGIKEESVAPIRDEILADLEIELSSMAKDSGARVRRSQLEQQIEAVTQRFDRIIAAGGKDSTIKFEDIGVDFVFVDEAHAFRKLDFHTAQQIKGIDPNGSKRALDMYVKTRWLEKQKPGRSMVFASGTPVTNTMGELYTIMRFFAQNELDRGGISTFDAWARQFGEVMPALEPNAAGKYELVERFAKFDNVPELMSRVRQFMDVLTSENLGALVKRPDLIGGKPNLNIVMPSEDLKGYMTGHLANRIEASKKWKPSKDQPANPDPIVAIITDGRFAAIDPRFFGGTLGEDGSIITEMAKKVAAEYHATKNNVYIDKAGKPEAIKGSTQIVFYNLGFGEQSQKSRGFNSRAAFTKALTDGGVKRDEIAWFDDANTDAKKEAIFKDMRSGKIRILIGSAKKMGTGVNVQKRLSRLHYQDPPWFPADVEQPHGRIIRQGNQNSEVGIEWYTTKGTYQSTMWQMVARKQRFIDQAFTGDKNMRSMDDLGEASLFEQAAAVASGDPRAIQLAGLKQDVERLERLQAAHANEQIKVRSAIRDAEWEMKTANSRIATYGKAFKAIGEKYFSFTTGKVGSQTFEKQGEFGQAIKEAFNKNAANAVFGKTKEITLGKLSDAVTVTMDEDYAFEKPTGKFTLYVNVDGMPIEVATDASFGEAVDATGLARRMVNHVNSVESDLKRAQQAKTTAETDLNKLNKKYGAPFEYQQDLLEKYAELKNLEAELKAEGEAKPEAAPVAIDENGNTGVQLLDITQDSILAGNGTAVTKLKSLAVRLSDGKITPAEYKLGLSQLTANIASTTLNSTGPANIKAALQAAKQSKIMRADTIDFALWLLDKNPQLANALSMSLQDSKKGSPAGSYKSAERLITLFKQSVNIGTAVHEILHHTERMMPPAIQREIVREWQRAWNSEWDKSSAEVRKAMSAMLQSASGDKQAFKDMLDAYNTGKLNYDKHYQLSNPSEYWAVNATRLMSDKYTANNSWAKQAKQFIKDVIAYFKKTFGLTEKDPIIKALNAVMNGDGTFKSDRVLAEMMAGVSVMNDLQDLPSQRETTERTQQDLIKEFGKPTFSSIDWWDKSVGTQFNKAAKNPEFKKVFDLFLSRENATSLTAIRAAEEAPGFLPRVDDFKSAAITVLKGKKASRQHDLAAQAILEGTLAGDSVLDGKVWSVEELRGKGLDDQGIALYGQARGAINASLDEVAAAEGYAALQMFIPRSVRAAVMDNPRDAVKMLRKAIDKRIAMDEKRLQTMKNKGATDDALAELEQDIEDAKDALNTMEQIFAHVDLLKEAGYAPLMRFGKYFVSVEEIDPTTGRTVVNDKGEPNTVFFSRYETEGEAQEAYFRMKVANGNDKTMKVIPGPVNDDKYKMYAGISPETMALFAEVVGAKEVENKFYQQAISERSALKRRLERKAIAGYSQDLPRVLANFITSNGRHAAGRYYTRDINSAIKYIPREKGDVQKEAQRLKEYLDNPQDAGAMSSGLAFTWFLGGNIASAMINATQPVMMSFPYLSQWGTGNAAAALTKAAPMAMGKKQITDPQLRHDLKRAGQEGKVDAQEIFHLYTVGIQGVAGALSGKMSKLPLVGKHVKGATESGRARMNAALTLWGMPFAVVEGFNRRLTFIAAWNMAKAQGEADPYAFATRAVDETQGIYNKVNRPNWARSAVGRTVFTFTQFRVMNVELIKRMAKGGPAGRRAAAVYLAVLILAAGTAGLPYADDIDDIIDTVGQFVFGYDTNMKRNKRELAHKALGKFYGDLALYGMSSQLPMDFGGRMGLGNMIPATGIAKPSNKDRTASELMELGGPVFGGLGKQAGDAYEEAAIGNYGKAAAALAPSSIKNLTAGLDMMATGKAKDMRGREKIDVTPAEGAIKAIGFNPTNVANVSRKNMPIQQDIALQKIVESNIVDKWAQGIAQKDDAMVKDAMNDMETWNRKNPDTPVAISGRQIQSKAKTLMTPADTRLIKGSPREMRGRVSAGLSED